MMIRRYIITCRGVDEHALDQAFEEAVRRINEHSTSGADQRDDAGFYFTSTEDIPPGEEPA